MGKKLIVTVDAAVHEGPQTVIGRSRISRFPNDLARPQETQQDFAASYASMAADEARERDADAWAEGLIGDVADDPRSR